MHEARAGWIWDAACFAAFQFTAVACDVATFVCRTAPSSPGLRTRVGSLLLPISESSLHLHGGLGRAAAWPRAPPRPDGSSTTGRSPGCRSAQQCLSRLSLLPWIWSACWSVQLMLPASAFDDATFDCDTEPPSPGAQHADGCVLVRRSFLDRQPERERALLVRRRLADHLHARTAGLLLVGSLLRHVQVRGRRVRRGLVRLRDVAVVARAENSNGSVRVRRLLLDGRGDRRRLLLRVSRLADDLEAAPALAGVARPGSGRPSARSG